MSLRTNSIIFYSTTLGFLAGVLFYLRLGTGVFFAALLASIGVSCLLILYVVSPDRRDIYVALILVCAAAALGIVRAEGVDDVRFAGADEFVGKEVEMVGVVREDPARPEGKQQFSLRITRIDGISVSEGRAQVTLRPYPRVSYGDELLLSGELLVPENFVNETTQRLVYYEDYLASKGVGYQMIYPEVSILAGGEGSPILQMLFTLKRSFLERIAARVPEPQSALLGGMTVGVEEALGDELEDDFRRSGLIHIVVLSGYNVTIIVDLFMRLASFFPLLVRSLLGGTAVILFMLLVGASATIVRASIMALIVIFARFIRRPHHIVRALVIAALAMVIHNPRIIAFDPGFQLSFLATVGLIFLSPLIDEKLSFITNRFHIREALVATTSTQLFVLPLLLSMTGHVSLVSLPVNALALPAVPPAMAAAALIALFSYLGSVAVFPFVVLGHILSSYIIRIVEFFAHLPLAVISLPFASGGFLLAWYGVCGILIFLWQRVRGGVGGGMLGGVGVYKKT